MKIAGLDLSISSSGIIIEEVDEQFNIKNIERHGFTTVKKNSILNNIVFYNKDNFTNDYQRYQFLCDNIVSWCKDCEYVAVEDYAYSMSGAAGMILNAVDKNLIKEAEDKKKREKNKEKAEHKYKGKLTRKQLLGEE